MVKLSVAIFAGILSLTGSASFAGDTSWLTTKFVEPTSFDQTDSVPSMLIVNYVRGCAQNLVQVVRQEKVIGDTTVISVGLVVEEDGRLDCAGSNPDTTRGGALPGGRKWEVRAIKFQE